MKRAKNSPIGQVECPHKGCDKQCNVFKFRPRTEGRTSVFSGKFYAECPDHGRIGSDGNPSTSKYIETHYTPAGAGPEKTATPAPVPKAAVRTSPVASRPAKEPEIPKPTGRRWWQPLID